MFDHAEPKTRAVTFEKKLQKLKNILSGRMVKILYLSVLVKKTSISGLLLPHIKLPMYQHTNQELSALTR